ncbi:membrane protein [Sphaerisporangium siamense]|uniref:DUF4235 domain-containing protein n=1 Tax=Sphaerisporangium siamense TaxID=795645 RepID=A0A7W7D8T3_9ACTN|nr:DUF4235 domain-containing protein [Sphaerisporangium siamense]MBB4701495.1 hypothetical protein [Sphaerisporangium siamense]GII85619.1 membrane protein [Sphaerisporangium siamense]
MKKLAYRSVGALSGMLGGYISGVVFKQVWKVAAGKGDAPQATSSQYGWSEVLVAAAIQGAIFGVVKAAIDRATAEGIHNATGTWPGD